MRQRPKLEQRKGDDGFPKGTRTQDWPALAASRSRPEAALRAYGPPVCVARLRRSKA